MPRVNSILTAACRWGRSKLHGRKRPALRGPEAGPLEPTPVCESEIHLFSVNHRLSPIRVTGGAWAWGQQLHIFVCYTIKIRCSLPAWHTRLWDWKLSLLSHRCWSPTCVSLQGKVVSGDFEVSHCSYWFYSIGCSCVFLSHIMMQTYLSTVKINFPKCVSALQIPKLLLWGFSIVEDERGRECVNFWVRGWTRSERVVRRSRRLERSQVYCVSRNEVCSLLVFPQTWTFTHEHFPFQKVLSGGPLQFPRQPAEWRREA